MGVKCADVNTFRRESIALCVFAPVHRGGVTTIRSCANKKPSLVDGPDTRMAENPKPGSRPMPRHGQLLELGREASLAKRAKRYVQ